MIYVLSDIHGQSRRFHSILSQIDLKDEDTLYILGDVIDRNPDGIRILREIISHPNMQMLLGNHEHMMLQSLYSHLLKQLLRHHTCQGGTETAAKSPTIT